MPPPDAPTRRTPGDYSRGSQNDLPTSTSLTRNRTAGGVTPGRRDDLGDYVRGRQRILGARPMISSDPRLAFHDISEFAGRGGARAWALELLGVAGGVIAADRLIDLAAVPGLAQEAASTTNLTRKASLLVEIERRVSSVVGDLAGGAS